MTARSALVLRALACSASIRSRKVLRFSLKPFEGGVGVGRRAEQLAEDPGPRRRLARGRFRLQILDAKDLHAVDDRGGDAAHFAGVAQANAGEQLSRGLRDAGQHAVAMRKQGRGLPEIEVRCFLLGGGKVLRAEVGHFDEPLLRRLGLQPRIRAAPRPLTLTGPRPRAAPPERRRDCRTRRDRAVRRFCCLALRPSPAQGLS